MLDQIHNWVIQNYEWAFSGLGVTLLCSILGFIIKRIFKKHNNKAENSINIEQKSKGQKNTQIGIQNNYYGGKK